MCLSYSDKNNVDLKKYFIISVGIYIFVQMKRILTLNLSVFSCQKAHSLQENGEGGRAMGEGDYVVTLRRRVGLLDFPRLTPWKYFLIFSIEKFGVSRLNADDLINKRLKPILNISELAFFFACC